MSTVSQDFKYQFNPPSKIIDILLWIISALIGFFIVSSLVLLPDADNYWVWAGVVTVFFLLYGLLMGKLWIFQGKFMANLLIFNPLKHTQGKESKSYGKYLSYLIGNDVQKVFLQFKVDDLDLSKSRNFLYQAIVIMVSYLSVLFFVGRIISYFTGYEFLLSILLSFFISYIVLGFYLPLSKVIEDSRIMVIKENGTIEFAGSKISNYLTGFFGITGVISGYDEFAKEGNGFNIIIFVFIAILFVILGFPILFPALFTYFRGHVKLVNNFRSKMMELDIYPARTSTSPLSSEELQLISINEIRTPTEIEEKTFFGKLMKPIRGTRFEIKQYSIEEREKIEKLGAWICEKCTYVNPTKEKSICENCMKPR